MKLNYYQPIENKISELLRVFWIDFAIYKISFNTTESIGAMVHCDECIKERIYDFIKTAAIFQIDVKSLV